MRKRTTLQVAILILFSAVYAAPNDAWLWLEEVDGINALAWVDGQNLRTAAELKSKPPLLKEQSSSAGVLILCSAGVPPRAQ